MPQLAYFDSTVPAPSPVLGWYDTDAVNYPSMPAPPDLIAMTDAQWTGRMAGAWAVQAGQLVAYTPPTAVVPLKTQAQDAFQASATTCYQSFTMLGEAIPQAWISYNQALQAIIAGSSTAALLPAVPSN